MGEFILLNFGGVCHFYPVVQGGGEEVEGEEGARGHGGFVQLFRVNLVQVIDFELFYLIIIPDHKLSVNAFRADFFLLGWLFSGNIFFPLQNVHNICLEYDYLVLTNIQLIKIFFVRKIVNVSVVEVGSGIS